MTRRPLFLPMVAFAGGCWVVLAGFALPGRALLLLCGAAVSALLGRSRVWGLLAAAFLLLGMARAGLHLHQPSIASLRGLVSRRPVVVTARVVSDPERSEERVSFRAEVSSVTRWGRVHGVRGLVQVSVYDPSVEVTYGDLLRITGRLAVPTGARNPGSPSYRDYLEAQGIGCVLSVYEAAGVVRLGSAPPSRVAAAVFAVRDRFRQAIPRTLDRETAGLVDGLVFSSLPSLEPETLEEFQATGTIHLLSTSGTHLAALVGALALLLGRARRRHRRLAAALIVCLLLAYCVAVGARSAVLRATVMGVFWAAAPLFGRDSDIANGFCGAALVLLALNPAALYEVGFQLSVGGTAALLLLTGPLAQPLVGALKERWPRVAQPTAVLLAAALAAQIGVAPLVAFHFGMLSLSAPVANLLVVSLAGVTVVLGLAHCLAALVVPPLAALSAWGLAGLCFWLRTLIHLCASAPLSHTYCSSPPAALLALLYLGLFLACRPWRLVYEPAAPQRLDSERAVEAVPGSPLTGAPAWRAGLAAMVHGGPEQRAAALRRLALPALLTTGLLAAWLPLLLPPGREARVTFLDVGQGDCILVRSPGGRTLLVDAGGAAEARREDEAPARRAGASERIGERVVVPALRRLGVRRLDAVLVTHPHEDHAGGLPSVLRHLRVGALLHSGESQPEGGFESALSVARQRGVPQRLLRRGSRLDFGDGLTLEVLHPAGGGAWEGGNNGSVVALLRYGATRVLLAGDLEAEGEAALVDALPPVALLKVAHHGSRRATSEAFLSRVRPRVAVISCGATNPFGHPDPETLDRLRRAGAALYRTDRQGAVTARLLPDRLVMETVRD